MYTWIRAKFNQIIKEEIDAGKKFVVCPYGEWGMVLVDLLKNAYGINDVIILDNGLAKYNPIIQPITGLRELDTKDRTLILTSVNVRNNEELERQIKELDVGINIRNILKPEIKENTQNKLYFQEIRNKLRCKKVREKNLVRIGNVKGDGGYIMVDDFDVYMRAYSFGLGNDISWDMDIACRGINIFMYDHTICQLPQVHNLFHFNKIGVGTDKDCLPLEKLMEKNNDLNNYNLILKMDVEGAEWEVLERTSTDLLNHFNQMTLELHDICKFENKEKILNVLQKLSLTHQAVWVHGNNANKSEIAGGILMPNVLEVTFARKDTYLFENGECMFPMSLDLPNLIRRQDYVLGNWG